MNKLSETVAYNEYRRSLISGIFFVSFSISQQYPLLCIFSLLPVLKEDRTNILNILIYLNTMKRNYTIPILGYKNTY